LSALGPGGLHRERATYEVRDVHRTHYGRICPIETPEGPSVGLIVSLGTFARINDYGFLETPYRKVVDGKVTDQISYLTAEEEDRYTIAQANSQIDEKNNLLPDGKGETLMTRKRGDFTRVIPGEVHYIDVSPKQIVGVSAALIPFLEHDDANRALMGSNMQRQSVPLVRPKAPYVGTGMEAKAARDSSAVVLAKNDGVVDRVSAAEIIVRTDDTSRVEGGEQSSSEMGYDIYRLQNFKRSNNDTCIHQKPLVLAGEHIKTGQVIADGTSTECGELALGNNALVAFLPWEGYNFEDAILISERLVKDDVYTSIHINEFEVEARETKMGKEEITRDIPNLSEEALSQLDDEGIIRVGSTVEPGTILVGKVTPKGESDLGPEEKLLRAIFGEKVGEVKDASSYAKPGIEGTVIDVKVFSRKEKEKDRQTELRENSKIKEAEQDCSRKCQLISQRKNEELIGILSGQILVSNLRDGDKILAQSGKKLTDDLLIAQRQTLDQIFVENQQAMNQVQQIRQLAQVRVNAHITERNERIEKNSKR
jgi:DNA-directed RNA polymerase subunit beta